MWIEIAITAGGRMIHPTKRQSLVTTISVCPSSVLIKIRPTRPVLLRGYATNLILGNYGANVPSYLNLGK
jgi:hypothetical protein